MDFFGSNGIIGIPALLFGGASFLLGAMLRKALNDFFDIKFSPWGSCILGSISFIIASNLISLKWSLLIGLLGFLIGGFALSFISGESDGEGMEVGGNYEE